MGYRVSRRADADLISIYLNSVETFGKTQAESYRAQLRASFELLAKYPESGRLRPSLRGEVRTIPSGSHVVAYRIDGSDILILRVFHMRRDWQRILR